MNAALPKCSVCGRVLKSPESIARRMGDTCARKKYGKRKRGRKVRTGDGGEQLELFGEEKQLCKGGDDGETDSSAARR